MEGDLAVVAVRGEVVGSEAEGDLAVSAAGPLAAAVRVAVGNKEEYPAMLVIDLNVAAR